jgi:recombinational DNA repair protein RecR
MWPIYGRWNAPLYLVAAIMFWVVCLALLMGVGPDTLRLDYLVERTKTEQIEEVILALSRHR